MFIGSQSKTFFSCCFVLVKFITTVDGSEFLILHNYSYTKKHEFSDGVSRYSCSSTSCNSYLNVNEDNMIVNALIRHNHPFDKDVLLENGLYEKDSNDALTAVNLGKGKPFLYLSIIIE